MTSFSVNSGHSLVLKPFEVEVNDFVIQKGFVCEAFIVFKCHINRTMAVNQIVLQITKKYFFLLLRKWYQRLLNINQYSLWKESKNLQEAWKLCVCVCVGVCGCVCVN